MNLSQLRCFHAVASYQSFTAAANSLNISQPSISAQVKRLEEAYQVELFYRHGRRVVLSEFGLNLLEITRQLFQFEEAAQLYLESMAQDVNGHVRIGGGSPPYVMPVIAELQKLHPGLTFGLEFGNTKDILALLLDNEIDVAVVPASVPYDPRLDYEVLVDDSLVALVAADHPLASEDRVDLGRLLEERLLIREIGSATRVTIEKLLDRVGQKPGNISTIVSREAVKEAVACGLGVSIVRNLETGKNPRLVRLKLDCGELSDDLLTMTEYVVSLKKKKDASLIKAFYHAARSTRIL
ncbi:hypothetical protein WH96_18825 [Kiloniella spongiae]|uniref:HTH lysR-type domain-containing protein n=1 Tax=Kiloniella spongiae TaxID=1489064 RepID=A0A0H2MEP0_9PROT|nr:LysR substrate-binding domain-containing protein [Kiloniella spongiae]KLN59197.1 hypothetical protein WH96_18825 [Kiloniella spongiae]